jgi:GNAT superfamily N-acetyltransferase
MKDLNGITVRKYQKGDEESIVELLDLVFNGWPKIDLESSALDHWKWKYNDRPMNGLEAAVALDNGRIIACLGSPNVNLKINEETYLCEPRADLAVHPDYRGKGVWRAMVDSWVENKWSPKIIGYNVSTTSEVVGRAKKTKATQFPSQIKQYSRINDIDAYLKAKKIPQYLAKKIGYLGLSSLSKARNFGRKRVKSNYSVKTVTSFDDRVNQLWEEVKKSYDLVVERRQEYLNWRYSDPRGGNYTIRILEDGDRLLGYSVYRINKYNPDYPEGYIVDLTCVKENEVVVSLIDDACNFFDLNDTRVVHYWSPQDHYYRQSLYGLGNLVIQGSKLRLKRWTKKECCFR